MKHVALMIPTLDQIGGAEQQVLLMAEGLFRRNLRLSIVTLTGTGGVGAQRLNQAGIEVVRLGMRKGLVDLRGWLRLRTWLRARCPDVLHAHMPHAAWMARWIRLVAPVRVVMDTIHTSATGKCGRQFGYRLSNWLTDQVTAVSEDVAQAYRGARMTPRHKLTVLPNGVEMRAWERDAQTRSAMRQEMGLHDEFLWLATGRLEPVKDYATLLHAFELLPTRAHLAIAGAGSQDTTLKALAHSLGVSDRVHFAGFVQRPQRWMHAADGYVLTSLWEGLPMGVLEAAASGLPTVATDVPGTRLLVTHGRTGLLAEGGNPSAVAREMLDVMHMSDAKRATMGECARLRVMSQFGLCHVLNCWERMYQTLLEVNPMPRRWAKGMPIQRSVYEENVPWRRS